MKIAVINQTVNLVKDDTIVEKSNKTYTVEFTFNEHWDGFTKTVRFMAGSVIQTAPLENNRCVIPSECLEEGGTILMVRISGIKDISGEIDVTDTFWRPLSRILYRYSFEPAKDTAIRSGELVDHSANFYTTEDMSGLPAFTLNFPEEMFLDQAETRFVDNFVWSAALYPGSTDPNLDGKPVFVLAVRGEDETDPTYSFLNMQTLVDTYSSAPGDGSTTVTVSGYQISVNVNLSSNDGNIITKDASGKLYAAHQDISGKMNKPVSAVDGNLAKFNGNKEAVDSGIAFGDVQKKLAAASFTAGNVRTSDENGFALDSGIPVSSLLQGEAASDTEINNMLDEVFT